MKNRDYIDQIKLLINLNFDQYKVLNGVVTREFFESEGLKTKIRAGMTAYAALGFPELSEEKFEGFFKIAVRETKHANMSGMSPSISLTGNKIKGVSWLTAERIRELNWDSDEIITYRARYIRYLEKLGRSKQYIEETKRSSLEILKKIGDPKSKEPFYVRGLVVGSVQSGKTANFNAVINSAVDAGYDLIIVLSGIMEDLRQQTQVRIEKEVEGKYKSGVFTGVGAVSSFGSLGEYPEVRQIVVPTSPDTDFSKSIKEADFTLNNKNILICKKNTSVLKNLLLWLHSYLNKNKDKIEIPFLIVDDEADNASLNNLGEKGINYASVINGHIRALLALFNKKTYIGYTATPFGNVLQDRNEAPDQKWPVSDKVAGETVLTEFDQEKSLFPEDFIELLFPPPNYIGPKHFFETRLEDIKKIDPLVPSPVTDYLASFPARVFKDDSKTGPPGMPTNDRGTDIRATTKDDKFPVTLPDSLKEAIMCFVVSTAIRISRKADMLDSRQYQPHNTMLIHISRFTKWQTRTKTLVEAYINELKEDLDSDFPTDSKSVYGVFERIWYKYYAYVMENIANYLPDEYEDPYLVPKTFEEIKRLLLTSITGMEIKAINSETKDKLIYPENTEKKYIAIGGNRLSRGFTLEGLTINYFIRNTNYADTLLQMGRWFGYRPGYIDCCKLFSTQDSLEKFDQTTSTMEDLEQKFIDMNKNPENTPSKYALLVLKHPGALKITRPSILKNTKEVNWSFSDQLVQTTWFSLDRERMLKSWNSLKTHFHSLKPKFADTGDGYMVFEDASASDIFGFLNLPNTYYDKDKKAGENYFSEITEFIKLANAAQKLTNWTIGIKTYGFSKTILKAADTGFNSDVKLTLRGGPDPAKQKRWFDYIAEDRIFRAGMASANIVTGSNDMAVALSEPERTSAKREYQKEFYKDLKIKNPDWSEEQLEREVKGKNVPEKAYRCSMTDKQGVLMIYLLDTAEVFMSDGSPISGLESIRDDLDLTVPLIGYAIGLPPLNGDIGGTYLQSKYHIEPEPPAEDGDDYDDFKDVLE